KSNQQPAVLVVGGEEVGGDPFLLAGTRAKLESLPEAPNAPLDRQLRRVHVCREAAQPEPLDDLRADQLLFRIAGELEDPAATGDDAGVAVADDEAGVRGGVVVVHQLEEEPEPAAVAGDGDVVELLEAVVVDGALLAVGADEERHGVNRRDEQHRSVARPPCGSIGTESARSRHPRVRGWPVSSPERVAGSAPPSDRVGVCADMALTATSSSGRTPAGSGSSR